MAEQLWALQHCVAHNTCGVVTYGITFPVRYLPKITSLFRNLYWKIRIHLEMSHSSLLCRTVCTDVDYRQRNNKV